MESKMTKIIEKAAQIVVKSGLENLTVSNLANELNIEQKELLHLFEKDDGILLMIFNSFENDLKEFIHKLSNNAETPEKDFKTFFKSLYNVFLQNPHYLSIIFDRRLKKRDERIEKSIFQMKDLVENYLTKLIDAGKKNNTFKTKVPARVLAGKMLVDFRMLMRDEQYLNEMILQMETLKKSKD
jgi:hypothetical protein